ncbi:MAG: hypothetical protein EBX09_04235 [Actinobacteria bacterium]|nr:hypothetical protein [Actinomycetota bacterium]
MDARLISNLLVH